MINYQQKILLGIVMAAMLMTFTSITIANANNEKQQDEVSEQIERVSYEHKSIRPHFNFYYQLLAEKYAPNHVQVWYDVIKERDALLKKYKELKKSGEEIEKFYEESWLNEHGEIHQQFTEAVEKRDEEQLKQVVPRVIDHQKELNSILKNRLKEFK